MKKNLLGIVGALAVVLAGCVQMNVAERGDGFVALAEAVPDVILEPRYYSTYNFVGERIDGYEEPCALLTKEAARALKAASDDCVQDALRLALLETCQVVRGA